MTASNMAVEGTMLTLHIVVGACRLIERFSNINGRILYKNIFPDSVCLGECKEVIGNLATVSSLVYC